MTEHSARLPFESFHFTLIEGKNPRVAFCMRASEDDSFELHVEKGSAANPTFQFTRIVPFEVAQRFKDELDRIGVFGWDASYEGGSPGASCRWSMCTVFKKDVFSVASKGLGVTPRGFDRLLEELYRLDFPRPNAVGNRTGSRTGGAPGAFGANGGAPGVMGLGGAKGLSVGDLGAYNAAYGHGGGTGGMRAAGGADIEAMLDGLGLRPDQLSNLFGDVDFPGVDESELAALANEAKYNPGAFQQRMRAEYDRMMPDEKNRLLDKLASTGLASRAWWERFFRGY